MTTVESHLAGTMIYAASSGTMVAMVDHEVLRGPHAAAAADAERMRRAHSSETALTWVQSAEQTAWERAHTDAHGTYYVIITFYVHL